MKFMKYSTKSRWEKYKFERGKNQNISSNRNAWLNFQVLDF